MCKIKNCLKKIKVCDVATKAGSGTGSVGLWRYYALVDAVYKKESTTIILEIKQERSSVLGPYIKKGLLEFDTDGSRVAYAEEVQLPNANPFYGYTEINGKSYLVRERSPYKKRVDLLGLKKITAFNNYADACGRALALAHLQSDQVLEDIYKHINKAILDSVNAATFRNDISVFAYDMAVQVRRDWKFFKKAWKKEAFGFSLKK